MTIVNVNDIIIIRCIFIFASFYNSGIYLNVWCVNVRRFKFTNVKLDKCKCLWYTINAVFDDIWQTGLYMRKSSRLIRLLFSVDTKIDTINLKQRKIACFRLIKTGFESLSVRSKIKVLYFVFWRFIAPFFVYITCNFYFNKWFFTNGE